MKIIIDQYNQEVAQLESLAELDSLVAEKFGLPLRPLLTAKRDTAAAKRFFRKAMKAIHTQQPRVITVDTVNKGVYPCSLSSF